MKQYQYVNAYKVLQKYEQKELPLDISYKFFKLKQLLDEQWKFQIEREQSIFEKYKPERKEDRFIFETEEDQTNFAKELSELSEMEVDEDIDKIEINFNNRLDLSMADIEALDPFIKF